MQNNYKHITVSACDTYNQLAGRAITDKTYHWVMKFHFPGFAPVADDSGSYHIDINGCRINNVYYLFLDVFHKGFARAQDDQGCFHINRQGISVYKDRYKYVEPYYNGIAFVQTFDQQFVRINEKGEVIDIITTKDSDGGAELSSKMVSFWSIYVISTALSVGIFERLSHGKMHIDQLIKGLKTVSAHH